MQYLSLVRRSVPLKPSRFINGNMWIPLTGVPDIPNLIDRSTSVKERTCYYTNYYFQNSGMLPI